MTRSDYLGEFEQLVLLAILQLGPDARAIDIRRTIEVEAERTVTRGALYTTLERLGKKGLLSWEVEDSVPARGGLPRRRFSVTPPGLEVLRTSQRALRRLARGLDETLEV